MYTFFIYSSHCTLRHSVFVYLVIHSSHCTPRHSIFVYLVIYSSHCTLRHSISVYLFIYSSHCTPRHSIFVYLFHIFFPLYSEALNICIPFSYILPIVLRGTQYLYTFFIYSSHCTLRHSIFVYLVIHSSHCTPRHSVFVYLFHIFLPLYSEALNICIPFSYILPIVLRGTQYLYTFFIYSYHCTLRHSIFVYLFHIFLPLYSEALSICIPFSYILTIVLRGAHICICIPFSYILTHCTPRHSVFVYLFHIFLPLYSEALNICIPFSYILTIVLRSTQYLYTFVIHSSHCTLEALSICIPFSYILPIVL